MFTGIIRHRGAISDTHLQSDGALQLIIDVTWSEKVAEGDSVAVNGACLTVLEHTPTTLTFRLMAETLRKTNLGSVKKGDLVNLERPLHIGERLDGHFVQGHVDGIATVTDIALEGQDKMFTFQVPPDLLDYLIPKGSVTLDGVSLTVVDRAADTFRVSMMPYTVLHTTFQNAKVGYQANFEADMLGKYVVTLTQNYLQTHGT